LASFGRNTTWGLPLPPPCGVYPDSYVGVAVPVVAAGADRGPAGTRRCRARCPSQTREPSLRDATTPCPGRNPAVSNVVRHPAQAMSKNIVNLLAVPGPLFQSRAAGSGETQRRRFTPTPRSGRPIGRAERARASAKLMPRLYTIASMLSSPFPLADAPTPNPPPLPSCRATAPVAASCALEGEPPGEPHPRLPSSVPDCHPELVEGSLSLTA
jgi:hypothetical protein